MEVLVLVLEVLVVIEKEGPYLLEDLSVSEHALSEPNAPLGMLSFEFASLEVHPELVVEEDASMWLSQCRG